MSYASEHDPTNGMFWSSKKNDAENQASQANKDWTGASQANEKQLEGADTAYTDKMAGYTADAQNSIKGLSADADAARKNSATTYSTTIQPQLKNMMEQAQGNAGHAMSLQDAMNPNNSVAAGTRDIYEKQAQGEDRQNLASTGMLQSMGQQNMATTLGSAGGPMTGGQLQALMAGNQAQAGNAYARGQARTQSLRDQGRDMGFQRSDVAYGQGQDALNRYRQSVGDYESADTRQQANQAGYRNELGGYAGDTFNLGSGQATLEHGTAASQAARKEAMLGRQYGNEIAGANSKAAREAAHQEQMLGMAGGGAQGLMKMFGSTAGAAGGAANGAGGGNGNAKVGANGGQAGGGDTANEGESGGGSAFSGGYGDGGGGGPDNFVEQSSQNGGGGYSTAGSSPGASGSMGGMNLTDNNNRMATRSIAAPAAPQSSYQAGPSSGQVGGRLASLMPQMADHSAQDKAWKAGSLQRQMQQDQQAQGAKKMAAMGQNMSGGIAGAMNNMYSPEEIKQQKLAAWRKQMEAPGGPAATY